MFFVHATPNHDVNSSSFRAVLSPNPFSNSQQAKNSDYRKHFAPPNQSQGKESEFPPLDCFHQNDFAEN